MSVLTEKNFMDAMKAFYTRSMVSAYPHNRVIIDRPFDQYRFPQSKRKRVRKKWAKDRSNYRPLRKFLIAQGMMIGTTEMFRRLDANTHPVRTW